jgi:uncharacterized protein YabE (DUF348 family)
MKIAVTHARNPLMDWDINVKVSADTGEKIAFVEIRINDFPDVDETQDDPVDSWEKQLTQKGVYPGDNKVEVRVTDQNGKDTRAKQEWTGN